jgi:hypothetical protein
MPIQVERRYCSNHLVKEALSPANIIGSPKPHKKLTDRMCIIFTKLNSILKPLRYIEALNHLSGKRSV